MEEQPNASNLQIFAISVFIRVAANSKRFKLVATQLIFISSLTNSGN